MVKKTTLLYTGKAKQVFATDDPDVLWMTYTNQATALNGEKKAQIAHKGELNRAISTLLFKELTAAGIPTHYIHSPDATTMIVKKATMLPLEVVVRNYASGHFVTKFNVKPMMKLDPPIHEYYYKSDELGDPFMNEAQIFALHEATPEQLKQVRALTDRVNAYLTKRFDEVGITLVDFKLEYGTLTDGTLVLADELSPDNFRLVDQKTGDSLDKDVFRQARGPLTPVYEEVLARLQEKGAAHV